MAWQTILLIFVAGFQVVLGTVLFLVLQRLASPGQPRDLVVILRKDFAESESRLNGKIDLLLARVLGQDDLSTGLDDLAKSLQEIAARVEQPVVVNVGSTPRDEVPVAVPWPPNSEGSGQPPGPSPRLKVLLNHPDFLSSVWQDMHGAFDVASGHLLDYLSAHGTPEFRIDPFPPLPDGNPNHWIFAIVQGRDAVEAYRILIPRNFSRYDPVLHDHLFEVRGRKPTLDNYIRQMQRCAVLTSVGMLEGLIARELVVEKGDVIV